MFTRNMRQSWIVALLALGLAVFVVSCDEESNDDPVGPVVDEYAPVLIGPEDGSSTTLSSTAEFVLSWEAVDSATGGYYVEVAGDAGFAASSILIETTVEATEYDLQLTHVEFGASYYWRVASILSDDSYSDYSEVRSFSLNAPSVANVTILSGEITSNTTLTASNAYLLRGGVFVGHDDPDATEVTLTIEPGTVIYGEKATDGMLVIRRSGVIMAEGTSSAPIVFTSDQPTGSRSRGDWGGVIINGEATLNTGSEAIGEGDTGPYGGTDDTDDSGTLRYVRIEFAGREISPDNELNGLALQGVGSGTTIEYVQIHMNKDDGIEFFGGTAQAKYLLCTGIGDDNFDWTDGWRGKGQFWVGQQYGSDADQGIEADNNADENTATPYANPAIANITLIGDKQGDESDIGMLLREGTKAKIYNAIIMNFGDCGLDVDHDQTFTNAANGELIVDYCIFDTSSATGNEALGQQDDTPDFDDDAFIQTTMTNNSLVNEAVVTDGLNKTSPDFTATGLATTKTPFDPTTLDANFFETVDFIGGVDPDADWTVGWTTSDQN